MMNNNSIFEYFGSVVTCTMGAVVTAENLQLILFALGIASAVLTICFDVWKWVKKARADKKITLEEVEELETSLKEDISKLEGAIHDKQGK